MTKEIFSQHVTLFILILKINRKLRLLRMILIIKIRKEDIVKALIERVPLVVRVIISALFFDYQNHVHNIP